MADIAANPLTNAPVFAPPPRPLRSASHSPVRRQVSYGRHVDADPLLRNLSPTVALRAFGTTRAASPRADALAKSFEHTSDSRRVLGQRAAGFCVDVRAWVREVEAWEWDDDNGFEQRKERKRRKLDEGDELWSGNDGGEEEVEWWGSLTRQTVEGYEKRIIEIERGVEDVDVEELKGFVRGAHQEAGMSGDAIENHNGTNGSGTTSGKLDDYTTVVTATILRALPYLSRLNKLLDTWSTRLWILRQVPGFLTDMRAARAELGGAWEIVRPSIFGPGALTKDDSGRHDQSNDIQQRLEGRISSLGRRLDAFLDELEGGSEILPERWIEDFEHLEQKYAEWRVQAEHAMLDCTLQERRAADRESLQSSDVAPPKSQSEGVAHALVDVENFTTGGAERVTGGTTSPKTEPEAEPMVDSAVIGSDRVSSEGIFSSSSGAENNASALDNDQISQSQHDQHEILSEQKIEPSNAIPGTATVEASSEKRSAIESEAESINAPTIVPHPEHPSDHTGESTAGDVGSRSVSAGDVPANITAKKRAAFLSDAERTSSLQRATKSPVRSFEHASNAFTRLFKKDKSGEHSRSSSATSQRSVSGKERTPGGTNGDHNAVVAEAVSTAPGAEAPHVNGVLPTGTEPASSEGRLDPRFVPVQTSDGKSISDHSTEPDLNDPDGARKASTEHDKNMQPDLTGKSNHVEDWPLASPVASPPNATTPVQRSPVPESATTSSAPELQHAHSEDSAEVHSPAPMESSAFDRMFVDNLPTTPAQQDATPSGLGDSGDRAALSSGLRTSMEWLEEQKLKQDQRRSTSQSGHERHSESVLKNRDSDDNDHGDASRDVRSPPEVLIHRDETPPESPYSAMSSPEIKDASIGYFPIQSGAPSQRNSVAAVTPLKIRSFSTPLASPLPLRLRIPAANGDDDDDDNDASVDRPLMVKRASMASIESHSRSELRSIDVNKRRPVSALHSKSSSPVEHSQSPIGQQSFAAFPVPPSGRVSSLAELSAINDDEASEARSPVSSLEESPVLPKAAKPLPKRAAPAADSSPTAQKADLNALMGKRRQPPAAAVTPQRRKPPFKTPTKHDAASFDRHVSSVLEALPAPIRFRSSARSSPRIASDPRPNTQRLVSQSKTSGLTLAPADIDNKKPQSASDPEVKLYHLTQQGKEEQPIRLFVRLVGENERVMVRVGGGWADLADYLRQYAEHHGSRTVSGGAEVDVSTLASAGASSRKTSGAAARQTPIPGSRPGSNDSAATPSSPEGSSSPTPANYTSTPNKSSRPSTADSLASRTAFASANNSGKKPELPEHKAKWIEGMLEKVTKASAEKARGDKNVVGEVGKVGGTRRVVFRSSSAMGGPGKK